MLPFLKRKKPEASILSPESLSPEKVAQETMEATASSQAGGWVTRLKQGLSKTRALFAGKITQLLQSKQTIDATTLAEMERLLLMADVGVEMTHELMAGLVKRLPRQSDTEGVLAYLREDMQQLLMQCEQPLAITQKPSVILVVGVNGSGKTTTIAKLACLFQQQGCKVMLAAGDTFRAAAIAQLQVWGSRYDIPVIAQKEGADTAAVIYDAMVAATARQADILIADTAGRLHTKAGLMQELQKVTRILRKLDPTAPHETLMVLDATIGQNTLNQVQQFHEAIGVTGLVLTKLDGTARGGIVFALAKRTGLPIRYLGVGEQAADLKPFKAAEFIAALFDKVEQGEERSEK